MFTGLVEGQATVVEIENDDVATRLSIDVPEPLTQNANIGDSLALNGCCLTVTQIDRTRWTFEAGPETLAKTNLGKLQIGHSVNIERPLLPTTRLGGHFVQGHVDGVATVDEKAVEGEWTTLWFRPSSRIMEYIVPKGSVAIDGVSLTVVDVESDRFSVALIPHTLEVTTLGDRGVDNIVNIEVDILAKYVKNLLPRPEAPAE